MKALTKTRSVGGSLIVTIPSAIAKAKMLQEGETIEIEINKPNIDFFGALKGIGEFTEKDRMRDRV